MQHAVDQVEQLRDHLRPSEPAAGHDECEQLASHRCVGLDIGPFEQTEGVVANSVRVLQRLERERVLLQTGQAPETRDRAESDDQVVVRHGLLCAVVATQPDVTQVGVNGNDVGATESCARARRADGHADVLRTQRARCHLGEHRGEQQVVARADQGDLDVDGAGAQPLQALRGADPAEPAAEDHDPAWFGRRRRRLIRRASEGMPPQHALEHEGGERPVAEGGNELRERARQLIDGPADGMTGEERNQRQR